MNTSNNNHNSTSDNIQPQNSSPDNSLQESVELQKSLPVWVYSLLGQKNSVTKILSSMVIMGVGFGSLTLTASISTCSTAQQAVTLVGYERLETDMTITDAQAALGPAIEVNRSKSSQTLEWVNCDGSKLTAVFKDGRLESKTQLRLK